MSFSVHLMKEKRKEKRKKENFAKKNIC